jgi:hypothetical protein
MRVDVREHLLAEVRAVAAGRGRVDELRAPDGRERVEEHDDRRHAGLVEELRKPLRERRDVEPGPGLPGQPLEQVDRGKPPLRLVLVRARSPHVERPHVWVAERVAAERLALDRELVPAAGRPDRRGR